jgi:cation diffusion facilitator CzcD-associated flavoprotein CzcO
MPLPSVDVAVIGAGPYGLSVAAHLRKTQLTYRVFGTPMKSWSEQMPKGMMLKSDGFASSLYDPDEEMTLGKYCRDHNLPYQDVGMPVPGDVFVAYGQAFQKRFVPMLEEVDIVSVVKAPNGFELQTANGETFQASQVVVAAGITHFRYLPPFLTSLPEQYVTHSLHHYDLERYAGRKVAVIGAGASAVDLAALLNEAGAHVELVARRQAIAFHSPSKEPRPLLQRILNPRSGLGLGWRSRLCTDLPQVFHSMPRKLRIRAVQRHLGPAPGWFVRDKVVGRFPMHLGSQIKGTSVENGKVHINIVDKEGNNKTLVMDHVIGATGFQVQVSRLRFLADSLRNTIRVIEDSPVLSRQFETSVPGLYLVGLASAHSFGPLTRFAYGARFTSKQLTRHLVSKLRRTVAARQVKGQTVAERFS